MSSRYSEIICFKHCNDSSIFCKKVPTVCPLCKTVVTSYIIEPFVVPYPFGDAAQNPCGLAVRPSRGNFLRDYRPADDLHVALTNSAGQIFEFDNRGLTVDDFSKWTDCLNLDVTPESWNSHWDAVLSKLCDNPKWNMQNYHETLINCFDFAIEFFQNLNYPDSRLSDKLDLCESFVLPKLRDSLVYVSLYKNLRLREYYIPR